MTSDKPELTLKRFYQLMADTRDIRAKAVQQYVADGTVDPAATEPLKQALQTLKGLPETNGRYRVQLGPDRTVDLDLSYEIGELEKDLIFFTEGEDRFARHLAQLHPEFDKHVHQGLSFLGELEFNNFVTDRDGTINNYCGRYRSSVQSAYNAVFLTRFIRRCTKHSVLITSAPLKSPGVLDVTVCPTRTFIYAASKAREFVDAEGNRHTYPIHPDQQRILDRFNLELQSLVNTTEFEKFGLIGSGLQFKFGQTTIAHQDFSRSVSDEESETFLSRVKDLVGGVDPEHRQFALEDTGLDLEIILKVAGKEDDHSEGDFDKGDGLLFLDRTLGLDLDRGPTLVCGDTGSDLKLVQTCTGKTDATWAIFVTRNDSLAEKVRSISPASLIVPEPDVLVAILNAFALR